MKRFKRTMSSLLSECREWRLALVKWPGGMTPTLFPDHWKKSKLRVGESSMPNSSQRASSSRHSALAQLNKVLDGWPMRRHGRSRGWRRQRGGHFLAGDLFSWSRKSARNLDRESPMYRPLVSQGRVADCWTPSHNDFGFGRTRYKRMKMFFVGTEEGARLWSPRSLGHRPHCMRQRSEND